MFLNQILSKNLVLQLLFTKSNIIKNFGTVSLVYKIKYNQKNLVLYFLFTKSNIIKKFGTVPLVYKIKYNQKNLVLYLLFIKLKYCWIFNTILYVPISNITNILVLHRIFTKLFIIIIYTFTIKVC